MKYSLFILVAVFSATSAQACNTVMGGCDIVQTHDTSSHMKSQIVNKVLKPAPVVASTINSKPPARKSNATGSNNLLQAVSKTVLK